MKHNKINMKPATNMGFCASWADGSPIIFGSLLGFGSGRSFSIGLLYFFLYVFPQHWFWFRADSWSIPNNRKALCSLGAIRTTNQLQLQQFID